MEILLNLVWAAFAVLIAACCLRAGNRTPSDKRRQVITLCILVAILFPVISVSDDLMAIQFASEPDTALRKSDVAAGPLHQMVPVAVLFLPMVAALLSLCRALPANQSECFSSHKICFQPSTGIRPPPFPDPAGLSLITA